MQSSIQGTNEAAWVALHEWSGGSGRTQTPRFTTKDTGWRITWKTTGGDPDPLGNIDISVRDAAGHLVTFAANLGQRAASGSVQVASQPGEYYLEIESAERKWHVAVEQPRSSEAP